MAALNVAFGREAAILILELRISVGSLTAARRNYLGVRHVPKIGDHSVDIVHAVLEVATEIARKVEQEHGACRVLTNLGEYQDSKHLHFHVNSGEPRA